MTNAAIGAAGELKRLAALRSQGVLTDEEFAAQKQRILGAPQAKDAPTVTGGADGTEAVGDLWVYFLIAMPLVALVVSTVMGPVPGSLSAPSAGDPVAFGLGKFFMLPNLVLMLLDHGRLKAAGKALAFWQLVLGWMLIPFYLFFRAIRLGRGMGYVGAYIAVPVLIVVMTFLYFLVGR